MQSWFIVLRRVVLDVFECFILKISNKEVIKINDQVCVKNIPVIFSDLFQSRNVSNLKEK